MSPTSYQLLYPAIFNYSLQELIYNSTRNDICQALFTASFLLTKKGQLATIPMETQKTEKGSKHMRVVIQEDYSKMCKWAANYIAAKIKAHREDRPFVLGLPTGSSPIGVYKELARMNQAGELSFANVVTFNMDEQVDAAVRGNLLFIAGTFAFRIICHTIENVDVFRFHINQMIKEIVMHEVPVALVMLMWQAKIFIHIKGDNISKAQLPRLVHACQFLIHTNG